MAEEVGFIISTRCNSVQLTHMSQNELQCKNLSYSPNDHEWNFFNLSLRVLLISLKRHMKLMETSMSSTVHLPLLCQYLLSGG